MVKCWVATVLHLSGATSTFGFQSSEEHLEETIFGIETNFLCRVLKVHLKEKE